MYCSVTKTGKDIEDKFIHITVDAGAAAKFYHMIRNNSVEFKDVLIYLGDFQSMIELFSIIEKIIQGGHCISGKALYIWWHQWRLSRQAL